MRTSGKAGRADVANHLPALDRRSRLQSFGEALEVGIKRIKRTGMVDTNTLAKPSHPASVYDLPARDNAHRRAGRSGEIDAQVGPHAMQYGVESRVGKHGGDAGKLQGVAKELSVSS